MPKLALVLIAFLIPLASGCGMRPYYTDQFTSEQIAHEIAILSDPYEAAKAAARSELADRRIAVELLRDLANRYRIAGRDKVLASLDAALDREGTRAGVASGQLQAAPRLAAARTTSIRKTEADTHAAVRQSFDPQTSFGALVHRCVDIMAAGAGKPTYNPKLHDWLCRASILPEAVEGIESGTLAESERWTHHAFSIERLARFAERCAGTADTTCGDAAKLIAQLINQQPVVPVPQHLNKISVERATAPTPAAAAVSTPPTTQTN